jgi:hypothetical protein
MKGFPLFKKKASKKTREESPPPPQPMASFVEVEWEHRTVMAVTLLPGCSGSIST